MQRAASRPAATAIRHSAPSAPRASRALRAANVRTYATGSAQGSAAAPLVNKTVGQLLTEQKEKLEHKDLLVVPHQDIKFTHIELDRYVRAWGNGLADASVRRKPAPAIPDRVLAYLPNNAENLVTQLGTAMAGRIVVTASPELTASAEDVDAALKSLEARMVVTPAKYHSRNLIDFFNSLDEELNTWPANIPLNLKKYPVLRHVVNTGDEYHQAHEMWRDLMLYDPTPSLLPPAGSVSPNEAAVGYLTSDRRTVLFTHSALVNSGSLFGSALGVTPQDRICLVSPLYTPEGLQAVLATVAHGAAVVIPSAEFDAEEVVASLERDSCTILHISPAQLKAVVDSPLIAKHKPTTLQKIVVVGSAHEAQSDLSNLVERATGLLKAKEVVIAHTANNVAGALFTNGRLLPHVEAKVVDGGKAAKAGTTGKLFVKGFNVAQGYWGGAKATDKEGWLDTGLQASSSADGLFTIKH